MKRSWRHLKYVQTVLKNKSKDKRLPKYVRDFYERLNNRLLWHESDVEDAISEALMQGIRNPAFPDDLVGWLDDDFDFDDKYGGKNAGKNNEDEEDKKD